MDNVKVTFLDGSSQNIPAGTLAIDLSKEFQKEHKSAIVAIKANNDIKELTYSINKDCNIEFIDLDHPDGKRIYRRSAVFMFIKAMANVFPDREMSVNHSVSNSLYCELKKNKQFTEDELKKISAEMAKLSKQNIPFIKKTVPLEEAKEIFKKAGKTHKLHAIEFRDKPYVTIYECDGLENYFYGYMVPHTGYINHFKLKLYPPGFILMFPEIDGPASNLKLSGHKRLFTIFKEFKNWGHILGVDCTGDLNHIISQGQTGDIVRISEALHEKKLAQISDMVCSTKRKKKIILISGPSSSGKTTFAKRLSIQLRVNGLKPVTISLDDYFVDRDYTPRDEKGDYDFEALEAIDVALFNQHLSALVNGEEVEIPTFNFQKGCREYRGNKLKIDNDQILVIEGIHALNNKLTASIPKADKFKIYISALTALNIDEHNRIPTTDCRLIRRIVRDFQFRGNSAEETIKRWPSVRRGEEKNIFPFQEEADIMFNSALIYELCALKTLAEPALLKIQCDSSAYCEAKRLLEFLRYFLPIDVKDIPVNSIIREFVGGSCFNY